MIKRIRFLARRPGVTPQSFAAAWPPALLAECRVPSGVRPSRAAVCTVLHGLTAAPPYEAIDVAWFTDTDHLAAHRSWSEGSGGRAAREAIDRITDPKASVTVVAEEVVRRGADWLARQRRGGGAVLKHMAVARRADGLTPDEFSRRWQLHAGRLTTSPDRSTVIPDHVRGCAYVQNHPCAGVDDVPYDAVNDVYLTDLAALRARIAWFESNPRDVAADTLFGENWFAAVREQVLVPGVPASRISA